METGSITKLMPNYRSHDVRLSLINIGVFYLREVTDSQVYGTCIDDLSLR